MTGALAAVVGGSYLLGSFPTSWLVGRLLFGLDLREHGSGNVGATNALRVLGKPAGAFSLAVDMGKGAAAVLLTLHLAAREGLPRPELFAILAGACAILGHVYTVWLRFQGGKGVATAGGVFLALAPRALLADFAFFVAVVALSRYVSLGSVLAALALTPLVALDVGRWDHPYVALATVAAALVVIRHRANLARLLAGTESKLGRAAAATAPAAAASAEEVDGR